MCAVWPCASAKGGTYYIVLIFSSRAPIFMMDKSTFFPLRFCSLAVEFVTKHREAALSHITFTVPFLVSIFCTCSRQLSVTVLLQTFVDPEAEALDMFGICLSSCRDWWCVSGQSFMLHIFFVLHTRDRCPTLRQDQQAFFSFSNVFLSSIDFDE